MGILTLLAGLSSTPAAAEPQVLAEASERPDPEPAPAEQAAEQGASAQQAAPRILTEAEPRSPLPEQPSPTAAPQPQQLPPPRILTEAPAGATEPTAPAALPVPAPPVALPPPQVLTEAPPIPVAAEPRPPVSAPPVALPPPQVLTEAPAPPAAAPTPGPQVAAPPAVLPPPQILTEAPAAPAAAPAPTVPATAPPVALPPPQVLTEAPVAEPVGLPAAAEPVALPGAEATALPAPPVALPPPQVLTGAVPAPGTPGTLPVPIPEELLPDCVYFLETPVRRDLPLERTLSRDELSHLAPETFGAPAWALLGPADAPGGAIGPSLRWGGLVIAGPGEDLPTLPNGSVDAITSSVVPTSGDTWAPGGRSLDLSTELADPGGLVQIGGPTSRAIAQITSPGAFVDGIYTRGGATLDLSSSTASALATGTVRQETSELSLLAAGAQTAGGTDLLAGTSVHFDELPGTLTGVGRGWTTAEGARVYRVGVGFALDRDPQTGLSAGGELEHWGVDARLTRRVGAWVEEQREARHAEVTAALRVDAQENTGGPPDSRADLAPRLQLRLHTIRHLETGLILGYARSGGALVPLGEALPATDQVVAGLYQVLPEDFLLSTTGTLSRDTLDRRGASVDVGLDREGEDLSVMAHVGGGAWTSPGTLGSPWASAVVAAAWNVTLGLPTRIGASGRWRSPGEGPPPAGAVGWLPPTREGHADLGGRAVVEVPTGADRQRLELEVSGWSRSLQISVTPDETALDERVSASAFRGEAAVRFAW